MNTHLYIMCYILYSPNKEAREKKILLENHKEENCTVQYYTVKRPHKSGPTQFKCMFFEDQLCI